MTNDEVLDFVRERLNREEKISKICEEVSSESINYALQPCPSFPVVYFVK